MEQEKIGREEELGKVFEYINALHRQIIGLKSRADIDGLVIAVLISLHDDPEALREKWRQASAEWLASEWLQRVWEGLNDVSAVVMKDHSAHWNLVFDARLKRRD